MGSTLTATVERAVRNGWIPSGESSLVIGKIESMAQKHGFNPDDFATLTHIESYGMNPRAINGSCVGIIQFCPDNQGGSHKTISGKSYNLASVREMSILQQLDLVDKYFSGVIPRGAVITSLDHFYFFVLYPGIATEYSNYSDTDDLSGKVGDQAAYLYVNEVKPGVINKLSVRKGLLKAASNSLGTTIADTGSISAGNVSASSLLSNDQLLGYVGGLVEGACKDRFPVDFSLREALTYTGCFSKVLGNIMGVSGLNYPANGMRVNGTANFTLADFNPEVPICPGCLAWPFKDSTMVVSPRGKFCIQRSRTGGGTYQHAGTDYATNRGLNLSVGIEVLAVADGTVYRSVSSQKYADYRPGYVDIVHEKLGNLLSRYGHIISSVSPGQEVKQGQVIGRIGQFPGGGAHLHLELRKDKGQGNSPKTPEDCKERFLSPELFIRKGR
jgi:hypothetical protein